MRASFLPFVAFTSSLLLAGCSTSSDLATVAASQSLAGNWNAAAVSAPASQGQVAALGGALTVSPSGSVSGVLHALPVGTQTAASLCVPSSTPIVVNGTLTADNVLTLQSSDFGGNTALVRGTYVAATGSTPASLTNASYSITGRCGVSMQAAQVVRVNAISGSYTGSFISSTGTTVPVSATLTQTTQPDSNGAYHLQGNATFAQDPCMGSAVVTDSTVTGTTFSALYTDTTTNANVVANGTLSADASTLTISNYLLSGANNCTDMGTGLLHR